METSLRCISLEGALLSKRRITSLVCEFDELDNFARGKAIR